MTPAELRTHYERGLTIRQLASLARCSTKHVRDLLKIARTKMRPRGRRKGGYSVHAADRRCMPEKGYCPTGARLTMSAQAAGVGSSLGGELRVVGGMR